MKFYIVEVKYRNGMSGTEYVSGSSQKEAKEEFENQVRQRNDVASFTVVGLKR